MTVHTPSIFSVDLQGHEPIYRQIVEQVRRLVVAGRLQPGDVLPSVRELSKTLGVAVMTVSKSYGLLKEIGVLEHVRGRAVRVAGAARPAPIDDRTELLMPSMESLLIEAGQLGIDRAALLAAFTRLVERQP